MQEVLPGIVSRESHLVWAVLMADVGRNSVEVVIPGLMTV